MSGDQPAEHFGCAECWPATAEAALEASDSLVCGQRIVDDSHLGVTIRSCARCGQRFVSVFLEHVDWEGGDDAQYWTLMPITEAESVSLAAMDEASAIASLNGLPSHRRRLQRDHLTGGRRMVSWGSGMWIVP